VRRRREWHEKRTRRREGEEKKENSARERVSGAQEEMVTGLYDCEDMSKCMEVREEGEVRRSN
jgi:hypothetical protein